MSHLVRLENDRSSFRFVLCVLLTSNCLLKSLSSFCLVWRWKRCRGRHGTASAHWGSHGVSVSLPESSSSDGNQRRTKASSSVALQPVSSLGLIESGFILMRLTLLLSCLCSVFLSWGDASTPLHSVLILGHPQYFLANERKHNWVVIWDISSFPSACLAQCVTEYWSSCVGANVWFFSSSRWLQPDTELWFGWKLQAVAYLDPAQLEI